MVEVFFVVLVYFVVVDAEGLHVGVSLALSKLEIIVLSVHALPLKLMCSKNFSACFELNSTVKSDVHVDRFCAIDTKVDNIVFDSLAKLQIVDIIIYLLFRFGSVFLTSFFRNIIYNILWSDNEIKSTAVFRIF